MLMQHLPLVKSQVCTARMPQGKSVPPLTASFWPVMNPLLASSNTASAISSALPARPNRAHARQNRLRTEKYGLEVGPYRRQQTMNVHIMVWGSSVDTSRIVG
jgi:hypothetical protein